MRHLSSPLPLLHPKFGAEVDLQREMTNGSFKLVGTIPHFSRNNITHRDTMKIGGLLLGLAVSRHGTLCGSGFKMFQIRFTEKNGIKDNSITMKCGYNCLRLDLWWWISNKHRGVWYYVVFIPNNGPIPKDFHSFRCEAQPPTSKACTHIPILF